MLGHREGCENIEHFWSLNLNQGTLQISLSCISLWEEKIHYYVWILSPTPLPFVSSFYMLKKKKVVWERLFMASFSFFFFMFSRMITFSARALQIAGPVYSVEPQLPWLYHSPFNICIN